MRNFLIPGLLGALLLSGCGTVDKVGGWLGVGNKTIPLPPAPEVVQGLGVEVVWSTSIGEGGAENRFVPALDDTQLYAAAQDGAVRALALDSGREVWSQRLKSRLTSGVAVGGGLVLVGNTEGEAIALSSVDGAERWRTPLGSALLSPAWVGQEGVIVQTADDTLHHLALDDGKLLWRVPFTSPALSLYGTGTPWADARQVVAGLANGKLTALRLEDGRARWEVAVARPTGRSEVERLVDIDANPQVSDGVAYAVSYHEGLAAVTVADGQIIWRRELASAAGLVWSRQNLYLSARDGRVLALDARNGVALWQQDKLQKRNPSAPVRVGEYLVVADGEGQVYWLRAGDGELVARHNFDGKNSRPVLRAAGERVLVQSASGRLALLALKP